MKKIYKIHRYLKVEYKPTENPKIFVWRATLSEEGCPDQVIEGVGPFLPEPSNLNPKLCSTDSFDDPNASGYWCLASPEILNTLAEEGYASLAEDEHYYKWQDHISDTPYTDRNKGLMLIRIFDYAHEVYGADNLPLPLAIPFDEIDGITEEKYNLNEAFSILEARKDCVGVTQVNEFSFSRAKGITFTWQPSTKDYHTVHKFKSFWERRQAILKLLGLEKCEKR